ncbi:HEAT repeat-containing protein 4 isoform X2 [Pseudophryne corroboree]|uniref:HEAT repeat-containing protein 4 isoform X2 n=1 Tax=Pseudophryne corroboree TaxID=495146 RepID=UPI00308191EE
MELLSNYCEIVGNNMKPSHIFQHQNPFSFPVTKFCPSNRHSTQCQAKYIQNVAGNFSFSKEVIKDRGLASLSYHEWNSNDVYNPSDIVSQLKNRTKIQPKTNKLCHVRQSVSSKQTEVKSCIGFGTSLWRKSEEDGPREYIQYAGGSRTGPDPRPKSVAVENTKSKTFLTEIPSIFTPCKNRMEQQSKACFPSGSHNVPLSCNEVLLKMETKAPGHWFKGHQIESEKAKHRSFQHNGLSNSTEPFSEEHMLEENFRTCNGLEQVQLQTDQVIIEVPTPETLLPAYYKMPGYSSPPRHMQEVGGKNSTAETLTIKHIELSPPLRLQDLINPKAGKYVYATENGFEKELYSEESKMIHQKDRKDKNYIVMDSKNIYKKHVQESLPRSYRGWFSTGGHAGANWKDATLEQLTRDLGSIHNTHKISALITIATSAVAGTQLETLPQELAKINSSPNRTLAVPPLPAEILDLVSDALLHKDALVRMAAALCQFLTRQVSEEARKLMFGFLESGADADSWAAAQCLALEGNHSYLVIKRILTRLFDVANKETEELCCYLLRELSKHTTLVHAMVGETLNSGNWTDRTAACRALAYLHGDISQDLKNKLSHLMWNDWSPTVRGAAAKALGKLGKGKEVHDQIRKHLECDSWKAKVEALCLIGGVRIMTAQLLPGFLQCFANDFVAVRRQACQTAGLLRIKDEMVINCLYQLIQSDPVWKIQAQAIKALGKLGLITSGVKELLLRAVQAGHPGVRIEAYRCIARLHLCDSEVQHALQDRLTLESHELASREVKQTLTALNLAHIGNQEMISVIKQQMPKLCRKELLFPKVLKVTEALDSGHKDMEQLLQNLLTTDTSCKNLELSGMLTRSSPALLDDGPSPVS